MFELGSILSQTWRRYWPNHVLWVLPFLLAIGGLLVMIILGSALPRGGPGGALFVLVGLWAYAAMALSGVTGVAAAAAREGKATFEDAGRGISTLFWRMFGYLGVTGATALFGGMVLASILLPGFPGMIPAEGLPPTGAVWWQLVNWLFSFALMMLYAFAPASIGLEDTGTAGGIGRGLAFVRRNLGLAVAVLLAGWVIVQVPALLVSMPATSRMQELVTSGGTPSPELMAYLVSLIPLAFVLGIYALLAGSFVWLSYFIAYNRHRPPLEAAPEAAGGGADGSGSSAPSGGSASRHTAGRGLR